jgi:hypothetical protein
VETIRLVFYSSRHRWGSSPRPHEPPPVPLCAAPGKKSLDYALNYQAEDRTLTDKEVDKAYKKVEDRPKHVLKAQIRGQEMAS